MASRTDDDSTLVGRTRGGDKAAFALLFGRHQALLRGVCRRYLGADAVIEDVVQEAALQALLNIDTLRRPERFGAWLAGIGLNLCRRWQRDQRHTALSWEALSGGGYRHEPIDQHEAPADALVAAELQRRVRDAVALLPSGQRDAVVLFYLSGHTQAETAALLGTPVGAVKTRLHKARAALRSRLNALWQEEHMATESTNALRRMRIVDVRSRPSDDPQRSPYASHVVLLEEVDGGRVLPIWVGPSEGLSLAMLIEKIETPRPLTPVFMGRLVEAAGARLHEVRITQLENDTFYAEAVVAGPAGTRAIDARPSDALILALTTDAPIVAEASLLERLEPAHPREMEMRQQASMNAGAIVAEAQASYARHMEMARQQQH
ncbi:MAG: bifunctional nuclease domain-containing protein [Dehalococcoidia bacterium]